MLLIAAGMTMARHRRGEALADVVHIDFGNRDFATANSRALPLAVCRHHPEIVIGVLEKILRRNPVTGSAGVARELKILLEHLIGVAPDPNVGTRAVERMCLAWLSASATVAMRPTMRFTGAATATTTILVIRS